MFEAVAMSIASQRCQQARRAECLDALPDLVRSEGFFEDLGSELPPILRLQRDAAAQRPAWAGMLASALGLRGA